MAEGIINLASYDGIDSWYCGVGTITKSFVESIPEVITNFKPHKIAFNVITPFTVPGCLGYRPGLREHIETICNSTGGRIIYHSDASKGQSQFGTHINWEASSIGVATILIDQTINKHSDFNITYLFDTPYGNAPRLALEQLISYDGMKPRIVWVPHSTGRIHETKGVKKDQRRYDWEKSAISYANTSPEAFIGYINDFMRSHLCSSFEAKQEKLIPLVNGLTGSSIIHKPEYIKSVLDKYGISPYRNIVYATGRAEHYKGFDALIRAFRETQNFHDSDLIIFTSTLTAYAPCFDELKSDFAQLKVRGKIIEKFLTQEEMMAIIQNEKTVAAIVPSRGEPFGLAPIEYWNWSVSKGPVIVASRQGGLMEQVENNINGLLTNIEDVTEFGKVILDAVKMPIDRRFELTSKGKQKVREKYQYPLNIMNSIQTILEKGVVLI